MKRLINCMHQWVCVKGIISLRFDGTGVYIECLTGNEKGREDASLVDFKANLTEIYVLVFFGRA